MHPRSISIYDFTYTLPPEKIAHYPLAERDESKLLIYNAGKIKTDIYRNISKYLEEDTFMVFNNTKVIQARLLFQKPSGGVIEIFCLEPHEQYADIAIAMAQREKVFWKCLVGGASKWKKGQILEKQTDQKKLFAKFIEKGNDHFLIELSWSPAELSFADILHESGAIPLPPYIKRTAEPQDANRYQTVYAREDGSVAAPTAGLHFTERIFHDLDKLHITREYVTLHVGAGTFQPVKGNIIQDHEMHAEWIDVSRKFIESLIGVLEEDIVAVGTTSLRTIESLYWIGVKCLKTNKINEEGNAISITQWEAYDLAKENVPVSEALQALLNMMDINNRERLITKTQILIAPGYQFRIVNGLITNFHQPQSTLLLLVAAFIGEDWKRVYEYALQNNFRFLSYGDGCLLWRK